MAELLSKASQNARILTIRRSSHRPVSRGTSPIQRRDTIQHRVRSRRPEQNIRLCGMSTSIFMRRIMAKSTQIVGGGTAGLTTAMRLSENNTASVAVIEAGSFYQMAGNLTTIPGYESEYQEAPPSIDWMISTTNQSVCATSINRRRPN